LHGRGAIGRPRVGGTAGSVVPVGRVLRLLGLSVKLASIAGPLSYGIVTWASGGDHRSALLLTGGYFVIGLLLLSRVKVARGRSAALRAERLDKLAASS
jgi:MFS-type transporter involved in bile tolerance (Atg22 family)